jgi:hypothetical protein
VIYVIAAAGRWNGIVQRILVSVLFSLDRRSRFSADSDLRRDRAQHFGHFEYLDGWSDPGSR